MNHNLYAQLYELNKNSFDKPFITTPDGPSLTYGQMDERCGAMAAVLTHIGVKPGDRVVVQVDKSPDAVALYLACLRSGVVYVPLNPAYSAEEVGFFLGDTAATLFVFPPDRTTKLKPVAEIAGVDNILTLGGSSNKTVNSDDGSLAEAANVIIDSLKSQDKKGPACHVNDPSDLLALIYTSGTTGRPKAAMISHHNLATNAAALHKIWQWRPNDVLLHNLHFFHVHGLFIALHPAMANSSEVLFLPEFDVAKVRQNLEKATVMMGVPVQYRKLLNDTDFGPMDCSTIRLFLSGSAPLPHDMFREFTRRTGHIICERYGMTECGVITTNLVDDSDPAVGSVGYPLPDVELRITNDEGEPIPDGEIGQIHVRGPNVFSGYWQLETKTKEVLSHDLFFATGDMGSIRTDGQLSLVGRDDDRIISGENHIYPKEVELILTEVEGVNEAAVVGLPHPELNQAVAAFITVADGITENDVEVAIGHRLDNFKLPKAYFLTSDLPRNPVGKVQKKLLKEEYTNHFYEN